MNEWEEKRIKNMDKLKRVHKRKQSTNIWDETFHALSRKLIVKSKQFCVIRERRFWFLTMVEWRSSRTTRRNANKECQTSSINDDTVLSAVFGCNSYKSRDMAETSGWKLRTLGSGLRFLQRCFRSLLARKVKYVVLFLWNRCKSRCGQHHSFREVPCRFLIRKQDPD